MIKRVSEQRGTRDALLRDHVKVTPESLNRCVVHTGSVLEMFDHDDAIIELKWNRGGVDAPNHLLCELDSCRQIRGQSVTPAFVVSRHGYRLTVEALRAINNDVSWCFFVLFQYSLIQLGMVASSERRSEGPSERVPRVPVNGTQDFEAPRT